MRISDNQIKPTNAEPLPSAMTSPFHSILDALDSLFPDTMTYFNSYSYSNELSIMSPKEALFRNELETSLHMSCKRAV